jgi:hypothetical protein
MGPDVEVGILRRGVLCPSADGGAQTLCLCIDFGADLPTGGGQPTSLGAAKTVLYSVSSG